MAALHHFYFSPVRVTAEPGGDTFRNDPAPGIVTDMDHLCTGICLLIIIGNRYRIKLTYRTVSFQDSAGIFPGNSRTGLYLSPDQTGIFAPADSSFSNEIINSAFSILIPGIPILYRTVFHFCIFLDDDFHNRCMQLIFIALRSGTTFQITHISLIFSNNQCTFELSCIPGIDPEISRQFHRTTYPFRNIDKRTIAEYGRIQSSKIIIMIRHDSP